MKTLALALALVLALICVSGVQAKTVKCTVVDVIIATDQTIDANNGKVSNVYLDCATPEEFKVGDAIKVRTATVKATAIEGC